MSWSPAILANSGDAYSIGSDLSESIRSSMASLLPNTSSPCGRNGCFEFVSPSQRLLYRGPAFSAGVGAPCDDLQVVRLSQRRQLGSNPTGVDRIIWPETGEGQ